MSAKILLLIPVAVIAFLNYKMLKIVQKQRKRVASETVVNPELERSEQIQPEQAKLKQAEPEQTGQKHNVAWLRQLLKQVKAIKTFAIIYGVLNILFSYVKLFSALWERLAK